MVSPLLAWALQPSDDLNEVIAAKEMMTGNLWFTWSQLLGYIFRVPNVLANGASSCFFGIGMMLQLIDDLGDTPVDDKFHAQNLFLALARQVPNEWHILQDFLAVQEELFLNWKWVRTNIPQIYTNAMVLYAGYMERVQCDTPQSEVAHELVEVVERLRHLAG
ncbi:MAG: hypothetical protein KF716_07640 [Anaerolineae bacterium]|nr:hypothetical protein [Anaerolineae bacterium]